jgi:hypothetical protein
MKNTNEIKMSFDSVYPYMSYSNIKNNNHCKINNELNNDNDNIYCQ